MFRGDMSPYSVSGVKPSRQTFSWILYGLMWALDADPRPKFLATTTVTTIRLYSIQCLVLCQIEKMCVVQIPVCYGLSAVMCTTHQAHFTCSIHAFENLSFEWPLQCIFSMLRESHCYFFCHMPQKVRGTVAPLSKKCGACIPCTPINYAWARFGGACAPLAQHRTATAKQPNHSGESTWCKHLPWNWSSSVKMCIIIRKLRHRPIEFIYESSQTFISTFPYIRFTISNGSNSLYPSCMGHSIIFSRWCRCNTWFLGP